MAPATASRLSARLRKRSAVLLVEGEWPGCEARLSIEERRWYGAAAGHGRLVSRRVVVTCRRGNAPVVSRELWLPAEDAALRPVEAMPPLSLVEEVG